MVFPCADPETIRTRLQNLPINPNGASEEKHLKSTGKKEKEKGKAGGGCSLLSLQFSSRPVDVATREHSYTTNKTPYRRTTKPTPAGHEITQKGTKKRPAMAFTAIGNEGSAASEMERMASLKKTSALFTKRVPAPVGREDELLP